MPRVPRVDDELLCLFTANERESVLFNRASVSISATLIGDREGRLCVLSREVPKNASTRKRATHAHGVVCVCVGGGGHAYQQGGDTDSSVTKASSSRPAARRTPAWDLVNRCRRSAH
jgi:hypothetical protein